MRLKHVGLLRKNYIIHILRVSLILELTLKVSIGEFLALGDNDGEASFLTSSFKKLVGPLFLDQ